MVVISVGMFPIGVWQVCLSDRRNAYNPGLDWVGGSILARLEA
jgi:hypothetical protein